MLAGFDQTARRDQRARRAVRELVRQLQSAVQQGCIVEDLADQSPFFCKLGRERFIAHHQFERALPADQARQQPGRTEIGNQCDPAEHLNEFRRPRRDDHVACHRKAEAAACRHAIDGHHDRHTAFAERLECWPVITHHAGDDVIAEDLRGLEILARAEAAAGPSQHQRPHLRIIRHLADGDREIAEQIRRHRIQRRRLIQCQHANGVDAFPLHSRHLIPPPSGTFLGRPGRAQQ